MDKQLANYIYQQLQAGYDANTIRTYLLNYGYPAHIVDEALSFAVRYARSSQIIEYAKQMQNYGYDMPAIKLALIRSGYTEEDIAEAFSTKKVHKIPKAVFIAAAILIIGVIVFLIYPTRPAELMDYSISVETKEVKAGQSLVFINDFSNFGRKSRYDFELEYRIVDMQNNFIDSKQEAFAIETTLSKAISYKIPEDIGPGRYRIQGIAKFSGGKKIAYGMFTVIQKTEAETCFDGILNQDEEETDCDGVCQPCTTCYDGILNQDEEKTDCGGVCGECDHPSCFDKILNGDEEGVDCGGSCLPCQSAQSASCDDGITNGNEEGIDCGGDCTTCIKTPNIWDILNNINSIGKVNPTSAVKICEAIDSGRYAEYRDKCYFELAKVSSSMDYCENAGNLHDNCYWFFVSTLRNFEGCKYIEGFEIKRSCEYFKQNAQLMDLLAQNKTIESN